MLHLRFARCQQWRETIRTYGFAVVQMV